MHGQGHVHQKFNSMLPGKTINIFKEHSFTMISLTLTAISYDEKVITDYKIIPVCSKICVWWSDITEITVPGLQRYCSYNPSSI